MNNKLEDAQAVVNRLECQKPKVQAEIEELGAEITVGLLVGDNVDELIQRQVTLKYLVPAINGALVQARETTAELHQDAQRQQLADLEREYAALNAQFAALTVHPGPPVGSNTFMPADRQQELKEQQAEKQALASRIETLRRQIDRLKQAVSN
jgi:DNA repair exonuclease SbcCD ATPase subunit